MPNEPSDLKSARVIEIHLDGLVDGLTEPQIHLTSILCSTLLRFASASSIRPVLQSVSEEIIESESLAPEMADLVRSLCQLLDKKFAEQPQQ